MDRTVVRNLVNILIESPLYLTLSLKERYTLLIQFMASYSFPESATGRDEKETSSKADPGDKQ
jgi:hypothetical protein